MVVKSMDHLIQPWFGTQWFLSISAHQEKNKLLTIFVAWRFCWSVQKPYFGGVSIGVKKMALTIGLSSCKCINLAGEYIKKPKNYCW